MKDIKLKKLQESYDSKAISKEEFEKKKKEIEQEPEKEQPRPKEEPEEEVKMKSDRSLIVVVAIVVLLFAALFGYQNFIKEEPQKTIDELHQLNLEGKLDPELGYLYKGVHSFIKQDDVWFTKLQSESGQTEFNFNFRYGPRELENITIQGSLDIEKFDAATEYFVTFNPLGRDFSEIRLARFDYDTQMIKVFAKTPKSACDRDASNQTAACEDIPIITCDTTDEIVVHFVENEEQKIEFNDNCITIQGRQFDFVKGVDRILYTFYGVMDK